MKRIRKTLSTYFKNCYGWNTNRKIIVIESDDWGSIRMPSLQVYEKLLKQGIRVDNCHYCKYDSLASETDLNTLFEILLSFKDKNGHSPIITANAVVANPDFERIALSDFQEYHYEPFIQTLQRYPQHARSFSLWQEGMQHHIFKPQFHGREHLNISRWMNNLKADAKETKMAFYQQLFGLGTGITTEKRKSYMSAFEYSTADEYDKQFEIIRSGLELFKELIGYSPTSFIAPNYKWNSNIEPFLYDNGIRSIQGVSRHKDVSLNAGDSRTTFRFMGDKSKSGLISLVRNVLFEPSCTTKKDWIDSALYEINCAFKCKKPAIICSHRVNYIGSIFPENRDKNSILLKKLLGEITKRWSDVEFLSSDELTTIIQHGKK